MPSDLIISSPWYYFVISLLTGFAVAWWLYRSGKKQEGVSRRIVHLLSALRFIFVTFTCFLLLSIFIKRVQNETENPVILLAIDNSASITAASDSAKIKNEVLPALSALRDEIGNKYQVKTLLFGSSVVSGEATPGFSEKETDIDNLFSTISNNYSNQNIGALILVTDGIYNKGSNPVYGTEKLGYPVYSVALGDTIESRDIILSKVNHNQVAYLGNNFPAEIIVNARKFAGREIQVDIMQEGTALATQKLKITSDNFAGAAGFTLNASKSGLARYTARVRVLDGEKNRFNNSQTFVIDVIDNKEKVLLLAAAPHPDIAAIKEVITGSTGYELDHGIIGEAQRNLRAYSLVIIHGFNMASHQSVVDQCKKENIPYWIVAPSSDNVPGLRVNGSYGRFNDAETYIDPSFGLFTLSEQFKKFSSDLPALKTFFGNYVFPTGAQVLMKQRLGSVETDNPVLLFNEGDGLKSALFAADGLWRWKMRDFAEHSNHNLFTELISKTLQYLAVKSDKSFFRIRAPRIVNENETVEFEAEVYNRSYEPVTDPDVSLTLVNADKKKFNYTFSKTSDSYRLSVGQLAPGEYFYESSVKLNGEQLVKKGTLIVKEVMAENLNTVADHRILYQLAERSGGKMYTADQISLIAKELLKNETIKPVTYSQNLTTPLIDLKWLFWLIILFCATEWFFRKRFFII